jgi:GNAT superfamily N-acetyltransferase
MDKIKYHRATVNDVKILVDLRIKFALELSGEQPKESIDQLKLQTTDYFTEAINDNTCISFIAKSEEQIAGIGSIALREQPGNFKNPSGKWAYIMNMYIVPAYRRKGICSAILDHLIKAALEMGFSAFELHATKEGESVYVLNGFKKHDEPTYRRIVLT